jgi:hypothetical protein
LSYFYIYQKNNSKKIRKSVPGQRSHGPKPISVQSCPLPQSGNQKFNQRKHISAIPQLTHQTLILGYLTEIKFRERGEKISWASHCKNNINPKNSTSPESHNLNIISNNKVLKPIT